MYVCIHVYIYMHVYIHACITLPEVSVTVKVPSSESVLVKGYSMCLVQYTTAGTQCIVLLHSSTCDTTTHTYRPRRQTRSSLNSEQNLKTKRRLFARCVNREGVGEGGVGGGGWGVGGGGWGGS